MNKRHFATATFISFVLLNSISALASGRAECDEVKSAILGHSVHYCALLPENFDRDRAKRFAMLYQLHGLGENEQSLLNLGGWSMVDELREKKQIGDFIVVTPAAGATFYVNSRDGRVRYEDFFVKEFIPYIEHRYRGFGTRAKRGVGGISMGGYGALHYAFKYPQLFSAVTAHSAALIEDIPNGTMFGGADASTPFGHPFDAANWRANSPFTLARKSAMELKHTKIYFDCGTNDDYGFEAGAQALHDELTKLGISHEFHLYPGAHNLADFAQRLPASLKFQSRALISQ
jgi:S-formylglutathione hydrolase FrmB